MAGFSEGHQVRSMPAPIEGRVPSRSWASMMTNAPLPCRRPAPLSPLPAVQMPSLLEVEPLELPSALPPALQRYARARRIDESSCGTASPSQPLTSPCPPSRQTHRFLGTSGAAAEAAGRPWLMRSRLQDSFIGALTQVRGPGPGPAAAALPAWRCQAARPQPPARPSPARRCLPPLLQVPAP